MEEIGYIGVGLLDKFNFVDSKSLKELLINKKKYSGSIYFHTSDYYMFSTVEYFDLILKIKIKNPENAFKKIYKINDGNAIKEMSEEADISFEILEFKNAEEVFHSYGPVFSRRFYPELAYKVEKFGVKIYNNRNEKKCVKNFNSLSKSDIDQILHNINVVEYYSLSIYDYVLQSPTLNEKKLKEIINNNKNSSRSFYDLLQNPNITKDLIDLIYQKTKDIDLISKIIDHKKTSSKTINKIFNETSNDRIINKIINNPLLDPKIKENKIKNFNKRIKCDNINSVRGSVRNSLISEEILLKIVRNYKSLDHLLCVADSKFATTKVLNGIINAIKYLKYAEFIYAEKTKYFDIIIKIAAHQNSDFKSLTFVLERALKLKNNKSNQLESGTKKQILWNILRNENKSNEMIFKIFELYKTDRNFRDFMLKKVYGRNIGDETLYGEVPIEFIDSKSSKIMLEQILNKTYSINKLDKFISLQNLTPHFIEIINSRIQQELKYHVDYFRFDFNSIKNTISSPFTSLETLKKIESVCFLKFENEFSVDDFRCLLLIKRKIIEKICNEQCEDTELPKLNFEKEYYRYIKSFLNHPIITVRLMIIEEIKEMKLLPDSFIENIYDDSYVCECVRSLKLCKSMNDINSGNRQESVI